MLFAISTPLAPFVLSLWHRYLPRQDGFVGENLGNHRQRERVNCGLTVNGLLFCGVLPRRCLFLAVVEVVAQLLSSLSGLT
eukprot:scaffold6566_cov125-Amphora_coffeaeformis.AAC.7